MLLPLIIFEDESLVVFDKPSGLLGSPESTGKRRENLQEAVRELYGKTAACAHRLDRETSGLSVWAKTKPALDFVSGQFQGKTADHRYRALVAVLSPEQAVTELPHVRDAAGGLPDTFAVDHWIGRDSAKPGRMRAFARNGGDPAYSEFSVSERFGPFAWVECRPQSSRLHQLRVHLASVGAPVLGDEIYGQPAVVLRLSDLKRTFKGRGEEKPMINRLALHASELTINHPETKQPMTLTAPLPLEFEIALKNLRKFRPRAWR